MSALFPPGIERLSDLPHTLHDAIVTALQFLAFEELPRDEKPPKAIWLDGKKLTKHFEAVEKRRKEKYEVNEDGSSTEIEDPVQNDAVRLMIAEE